MTKVGLGGYRAGGFPVHPPQPAASRISVLPDGRFIVVDDVEIELDHAQPMPSPRGHVASMRKDILHRTAEAQRLEL